MPHVSLSPNHYYHQGDVENVVQYIYNPQKTDNYRYIGFAPDIISAQKPRRELCAALMFKDNHDFFGITEGSLIHQLVLSFSTDELANPLHAWYIGSKIATVYFNEGYLCAYGVHLNEDNLHVHFAVDNYCYSSGKAFFIPTEIQQVQSIAQEILDKKKNARYAKLIP